MSVPLRRRVNLVTSVAVGVAAVALLIPAAGQAAKTPGVAWSPSGSFDYGTLDAARGGNASQTFTLSNTDGKPTGTLSISLTGSPAVTKTADTCTGIRLTSKKTCTVTIKYAPSANGTDNATLTASASNTTGASDSLSGASAWMSGDLTTYPQAAWGSGGAAASLLLNNYGTVYASNSYEFVIGPTSNGFSAEWTDPTILNTYLPAGGTAAALTANYVDATSTSSGIYGGNVAAVKLNIDFSAAGLLPATSGLGFGNLSICGLTSDSDLNGKTVSGFLGIANTALGGGATTDSIADLNSISAELDASFSAGTTVSTWAQDHLQPGTCP